MKLLLELGANRRHSNLPTTDEVAMIIPNNYQQDGFRDIVLAYRSPKNNDNQYHTISSNSAAYMPLYYVLFFPCGDLGWYWALTLQDPQNRWKNLRIIQCTFYCYMLHIHSQSSSLLFYGKRLFQQLLVDAWAVFDQNKYVWIPHMHLLIFLHLTDKCFEAFDIDKVICDKLSIVKSDPMGELTRIVILVMLHGLCGNINPHSPCMSNARNGSPKCTKHYPRDFFEDTSIQENRYPLYQRCNNGSTYEISHPQD